MSLSIIVFRNFLDDRLVLTPWRATWRRQEKDTRNSVFPKRVTLYLVGGKLQRWSYQAEPRSGPRPRKIRRLSCKKGKLRNLKAKLEEAYLVGLNEKQRPTSAPVNWGWIGIIAPTQPRNSLHFKNTRHFIHTHVMFKWRGRGANVYINRLKKRKIK